MHETTHQPLLSTLSAIVETVARLRAGGHKVVLVSSGAIGVGLQRMSMPARPKSLSGKQASQHLSISFEVLMRLTLLPTARHWLLLDKVD